MSKFVKKKFRTRDGFTSEDLIQYAIDHLASAKLLFERNPRCYDSAGYLAHLGLELMLKSILLKLNGEFPAEHNLESLYKLARKIGARKIGKDGVRTLNKINQFFNLRYTNPQSPIEIGDDDWKIIEQVFYNLLTNFPVDILSRLNNSNYYKKGGRILFFKPKKTIIILNNSF